MRSSIQRLFGDPLALVEELEASCKRGTAQAGLGEAGERLKKILSQARETIEELERNARSGVKRGMKTTEAYVHFNPWKSIGIAAAVAFIVGALVSRRDADEE